MDDDKAKQGENQSIPTNKKPVEKGPTPIFQAVPEESHANPLPNDPNLQPEEVSPELTTPLDLNSPPPPPPPDGNIPDSGSGPLDILKSRYFIIGAAAVVFVLLLVLVFRLIFAGQKKENITLVYWGLWDNAEVVQPLIDQYEKANPTIDVQYQKMTPNDYKDKLIARSKNNQGGPDIFRFHNTWIPEIKEVISPLPQSVMSNGEFERTFYKIHQKDLKIQDRYYGIPLMVDGLVLLYNENLFKKAGITTAPATWEDVLDYVSKLTVKDRDGQIITSGIAVGTTNNIEHFSDIFALFLVQNGGSIKALDSAEAIGALQSYRSFAEPGTQQSWSEIMPNSINAFIQEKVAMIIVPSWEIAIIQKANPDITMKVVPVPTLPGSRPLSIASYWSEGVSKFSQHQNEAWKFIQYLSGKDQLTKLYELQAKATGLGSPYSRVDLAPVLASDKYLGAVIKQAESDAFVSVPMIARTYDNGLNNDIIKYIENAINAASQGVSYQEAMQTAKQGVDQVFSRFQIE